MSFIPNPANDTSQVAQIENWVKQNFISRSNPTYLSNVVVSGAATINGILDEKGNAIFERDLNVLGNFSTAGNITQSGGSSTLYSTTVLGNLAVAGQLQEQFQTKNVVSAPPPAYALFENTYTSGADSGICIQIKDDNPTSSRPCGVQTTTTSNDLFWGTSGDNYFLGAGTSTAWGQTGSGNIIIANAVPTSSSGSNQLCIGDAGFSGAVSTVNGIPALAVQVAGTGGYKIPLNVVSGGLAVATAIGNTSLAVNTIYYCTIQASGVVLTLPNAPTNGQTIQLFDTIGSFAHYLPTLTSLGYSISLGTTTTMSLPLAQNNITATLVFDLANTTWRLTYAAQKYPKNSLSSTFEVYGDSVAYGYSLSSTGQRWSGLLAAKYGKSYVSMAQGGFQAADMFNLAANGNLNTFEPNTGGNHDIAYNHVQGNDVFIAMGTNDVCFQNPTVLNATIGALQASVFWAALPFCKGVSTALGSARLFDCRNSNAFSWNNPSTPTGTTIGTYLASNGNYVVSNANVIKGDTIVVGFVCFSTSGSNFTISVDGTTYVNSNNLNQLATTATGNTGWSPQVCTIQMPDSAPDTAHIVQVNKTDTSGTTVLVLYMGAFNSARFGVKTNPNKVFLVSPHNIFDGVMGSYCTVSNRNAYIKAVDDTANLFRNVYGLDVYHIPITLLSKWDLADGIVHPNAAGHYQFFTEICNVIESA